MASKAGLDRTYYSSVERGERNVSLENLVKIANALDVSLSKMMAEAEKPSKAK